LTDDLHTGLAGRLGPLVHDAERILALHGRLLRSELRESTQQAVPALASVSVGAGLTVVAGLFGSLSLVHAAHRSTRLPLWGCYGLVGGALGMTGAALLALGAKRLAAVNLVP